MSNQAMSRRRFIKTVGAAGLGLVAGGALAGCAPQAPQIQQVEVTRVTEKAVAPTATPWTLVKPGQAVGVLRLGLPTRPDRSNHQDLHRADWRSPSTSHIIPNVGYNSGLQTKIMGGIQMDVFYNFRYNTSKFYNASWARRLDDLPDADKILADMFASAVPLYTAAGRRSDLPALLQRGSRDCTTTRPSWRKRASRRRPRASRTSTISARSSRPTASRPPRTRPTGSRSSARST